MSTSLFGGSQATKASEYTGIQLQRSVQGACIPLVFGTIRVSVNLIWYGDFLKIGGGPGTGKGTTTSKGGTSPTTYQAACALALCEGPIVGTGDIWADKSKTTLGTLNLTAFLGTYPQTPWGYLSSLHPTQALGYNGIAYLASNLYNLGTSAQLPNHTVEVKGFRSNSVGSLPDADPSLVITDLLTNPHWGAAFPSSKLGDLSEYQAYALAQNLLVSMCYSSQASVASMIDGIAVATNSDILWDGGQLFVKPYGDSVITGNGKTFTPNLSPVMVLGYDDFQGQNPILWKRKRPSDRPNSIKLQYANRNAQYIPDAVEAKDQASIDIDGLRQLAITDSGTFALSSAAYASAQLKLQRGMIMNTCKFNLDARYAVLDPWDIVSIPDRSTGQQVSVRIREIVENDDKSFSFIAEELLQGTGTVVFNPVEESGGFVQNYNVIPDSVNPPIIMEPNIPLLSARSTSNPQIWVGISGGAAGIADPNWGGANAWVSFDGVTYSQFGTVHRPATMGVLTATLATFGGTNPDVSHTLSVDLTESNGVLTTVSDTEAQNGVSLCLVDNEFLTFVDANLTSARNYDLTRLYRGFYTSPISAHTAPGRFLLLDDAILTLNLPVDVIGKQLYFKFQSFNIFNQALESLASCTAYPYTPVGSGYFGPQAQAISAGTALLEWGLVTESPGLSNDDWGLVADPYPIVVDMGTI